MALMMVKPEEMEAQAGTKLPPGEWFEIDQERINTFADCTEDHQFIHIMRRPQRKRLSVARLRTAF